MEDHVGPILNLDTYLQVSMQRYSACIDALNEPFPLAGLAATARFHHLKLDSNGRPRWRDLAKNLAFHLLSYCFNAQRRDQVKSDADLMELRHEAREFFRDATRSGEAGEMLLYMLLEAALQAPQMVAKISLKTNPQTETLGSDGIHMKWNACDGVMDIYFGEAKLYRHAGDAIKSAVVSIDQFHDNLMEDFELRMVTRHFKHAESELRENVLNYVNRGTASTTVRVNHACLIGFNWDVYKKITPKRLAEMEGELKGKYEKRSQRLSKLLAERFKHFNERKLRFEIFVLPFESIDEFRDAFLEAL